MRQLPFTRFKNSTGPTSRRGLEAQRLNQLANSLPEIVGGPGIEITRQGNRLVVGLKNPQPLHVTSVWCRIQSAQGVGPNRWEYQVAEVTKSAAGYSGMTVRPNGIAGTARNLLEFINSAEGTQGNGINVDDLPEGFGLGPIAVGIPVYVYRWRRADTTTPTELWFAVPNPVVGSCPP